MDHYKKYIEDGYSEEQAFYLAEIKTTQMILADLDEKLQYSPTLLLNSLLSMIILPYEKAKNGDSVFLNKDGISVLENNMEITPCLFQPIKKCQNYKISYNQRNMQTFLNKLRNGIAHQNITVSIIGDREFEITIKNKFYNKNCNNCSFLSCKDKGLRRENGGVIDFEVTLTVDQLKKLANYIANAYLEAIQHGEIICQD